MTPTPIDIEAMRQARRAALLARWAKGERLSATEMEEISDLITPPIVTKASAPALVLESPPAEQSTGRRKDYRHPIVEGCPYEAILGAKKRNLIKWRAKGREASPPEMPPFDESWLMASWYRRHMERRVPNRLLELEAEGPPRSESTSASSSAPASTEPAISAQPSISTPATPSSTKPPSPAGAPVNFADLGELTFEDSLTELRLTLSANQRILRKAMEAGENESAIKLRRQNVEETFDLIRKCEKDLEERKKRRGELIDISVVLADWSTLLHTLASMRRRAEADILDALAPHGLAPDILATITTIIRQIREREDGLLRTSEHWIASESAAPVQAAA